MNRVAKQQAKAVRSAAPVRAVRPVRAQAMGNGANPEYRSETAAAVAGFTATTTPFDDWKFAPIREATVS